MECARSFISPSLGRVMETRTEYITGELRVSDIRGSSARGQRLSVRLDEGLAAALEKRCDATGKIASVVVREVLQRALIETGKASAGARSDKSQDGFDGSLVKANATNDTKMPSICGASRTDARGHDFPESLTSLCRSLGSFGAGSWRERRERLLSVIALARNCAGLSQQPRDIAMLSDLLTLAEKYALLP